MEYSHRSCVQMVRSVDLSVSDVWDEPRPENLYEAAAADDAGCRFRHSMAEDSMFGLAFLRGAPNRSPRKRINTTPNSRFDPPENYPYYIDNAQIYIRQIFLTE